MDRTTLNIADAAQAHARVRAYDYKLTDLDYYDPETPRKWWVADLQDTRHVLAKLGADNVANLAWYETCFMAWARVLVLQAAQWQPDPGCYDCSWRRSVRRYCDKCKACLVSFDDACRTINHIVENEEV